MQWVLLVIVAFVAYYFIFLKPGRLDFWKSAGKHPNEAFEMFQREECWHVFIDKPEGGYKSELPKGEWDGPFKMAIPMLGGKLITVFGKVPEYLEAQKEFMDKIQESSGETKSDHDLINKFKIGVRESLAYFSNANKEEREKWVVEGFLTNCGISFDRDDIIPSPDQPPDILFCDANFEVKEILDENRQRHREYKNALQKAENAESLIELLELHDPKDLSLREILRIVNDRLSDIAYAPEVQRSLDMLFYVDLLDYYGLQDDLEYQLEDHDSLTNFRSVSILYHDYSLVFVTSDSAPEFLRSIQGVLKKKD